MIDRYTKIVLTVIAAALTAIAVEQAMPQGALAQLPAGISCGGVDTPCYVATPDTRPLLVSNY